MAYEPVPHIFATRTSPIPLSELDADLAYLSGKVVSVKDYGAVGDGVTDDAAAFNEALSVTPVGTTIVAPVGIYRLASTVTIPRGKLLTGGFNSSGTEFGFTELIFDLAVATCVIMDGGGASYSTGFKNCTVTRAVGVVPAGCIGVLVQSTDSNLLEDLLIARQAIGLKLTGQVGLHLSRVQTTVISETHVLINGAVGVTFIDCTFGRNGGLDVSANEYVRIVGLVTDSVKFISCQFNLSVNFVTRAIIFDNYSNANGIFHFIGCHFESFAAWLEQTGTTLVKRLSIINCTLNSISPVFNGLPASFFSQLTILGCSSIAGSLAVNGCDRVSISGNSIAGAVTLTALQGAFANNSCDADFVMTGAMTGFSCHGNTFRAPATFTNTATGEYSIVGNVLADAALMNAHTNILRGILSLPQGQIAFPASQNPSTNPNTLDDYERGTATVVLAGSATPGTQTYAFNTCSYVKVGRACAIRHCFGMTAKDAATAGNMRLTGLPFTSEVAASTFGPMSVSTFDNLTLGGGYTQMGGYVQPNNTYMELIQSGSALASANIAAAAVAANTGMMVHGVYITAQ